MSFGVAKRASSVDYRDWHYLRAWQQWQRYMPPWQWTFTARHSLAGPGVPFFWDPCCFNHDSASDFPTFKKYSLYFSVPSVDFPFFTVFFSFSVSLFVYPVAAGLLDPLGNPYTLRIHGGWELDSFSPAEVDSYWYQPPYDQVFSMVVKEPGGAVHPFYPLGFTMTPTVWNHPVIVPL